MSDMSAIGAVAINGLPWICGRTYVSRFAHSNLTSDRTQNLVDFQNILSKWPPCGKPTIKVHLRLVSHKDLGLASHHCQSVLLWFWVCWPLHPVVFLARILLSTSRLEPRLLFFLIQGETNEPLEPNSVRWQSFDSNHAHCILVS